MLFCKVRRPYVPLVCMIAAVAECMEGIGFVEEVVEWGEVEEWGEVVEWGEVGFVEEVGE